MVLLVVCTIIIYEARKNPRRADRVVPAYAHGQISRAKRLGWVGFGRGCEAREPQKNSFGIRL